jgi:hypothetical protein
LEWNKLSKTEVAGCPSLECQVSAVAQTPTVAKRHVRF